MRIFILRLVFGYAIAFALAVLICIIVTVFTDFGEYITMQQQFHILLMASIKSGSWGFAYPFIMYFTETGKTRFKTLNSIKQHFDIDYPDKPY